MLRKKYSLTIESESSGIQVFNPSAYTGYWPSVTIGNDRGAFLQSIDGGANVDEYCCFYICDLDSYWDLCGTSEYPFMSADYTFFSEWRSSQSNVLPAIEESGVLYLDAGNYTLSGQINLSESSDQFNWVIDVMAFSQNSEKDINPLILESTVIPIEVSGTTGQFSGLFTISNEVSAVSFAITCSENIAVNEARWPHGATITISTIR